MMMDAKTKLYGLIGNPIKHSFSPYFQNKLFENHNINAVYLAFDINDSDLNDVIKSMKSMDIKGFNVTVPYKEKVLKFIDEIDPLAIEIGAVNTIKNVNGKLYGYNTDIFGFQKLIQNNNIYLDNKEIVILGSGGAAKSVVVSLKYLGVKNMTIYNRSIDKAIKIAEKYNDINITSKELKTFKLKDNTLVINATSIGLDGKSSPITVDKNYKDTVFIDLIYNPKQTQLLKDAKKHNMGTYNGLEMLLYQGIESFSIWTDEKVNFSEAIGIFNSMEKI